MKSNDKKGTGIFLSEPELRSVGCKNCILKLHHNCFHNLKGNEVYSITGTNVDKIKDLENGTHKTKSIGYCPELVQWLMTFAGETGGSSVLWENYHIFVARLQASEDYAEFKRIDEEIKELEAKKEVKGEKYELLQQKLTIARVWWSRVTEQLLKGLGRVNDRTSRSENVDKLTSIPLSQIHQIANKAKLLEDKNGEEN